MRSAADIVADVARECAESAGETLPAIEARFAEFAGVAAEADPRSFERAIALAVADRLRFLAQSMRIWAFRL